MRHRLIGLFTAALLAVAGMTAVLATQTAEASDPPRYGDAIMPSGFQPIPAQWMYLEFWMSRFPDKPILKVDTEHATSEGFYYAVRSGGVGSRDVIWVYQRYGVGCDNEEYFNLVFNPWMNSYWCAEDGRAIQAVKPEYDQKTEVCRVEQGQPWKSARLDGSWECWNRELYRNTSSALMIQHSTQSSHLAPWETGAELNDTSWNALPALNYWVPAPDGCTGVPTNGNRLNIDPAEPVGNTNVPNCLGQDLAPNCTAATATDPACGGPIWPNGAASPTPPTPTATPTQPTTTPTATPTQPTTSPSTPGSVTSTQSVTDSFSVTGVATRTEQATVRLKRKTVRVSVTKTINGRQVTKTGEASIYVKRSAQATAEAMLTEQFSSTGTATCTLPTQQEADNCALAAARENAAAIAADTYTSEMYSRAAAEASADALAEARSRATTAAQDTVITKKMIRKAKRQARQRALAQF
ncbi:hypothetical protein [Nocardioides sp.]|uniref:hypothetical protein n=1 Tax=Nocardioides sp. TaxID=35761 RepID=UPI00261013EF|nr:hypothetical protein [Nocardioides sp.]